jgi:hypothetical protein
LACAEHTGALGGHHRRWRRVGLHPRPLLAFSLHRRYQRNIFNILIRTAHIFKNRHLYITFYKLN